MKQTILLTGFGNETYGSTNPSLVAAQEACKQNETSVSIVCQELPVDYDGIRPGLQDAIERVRPVAVICLGVCMQRDRLSIESHAFNYVLPKRDDEKQELMPGRPSMYVSTLPNGLIVSRSNVLGSPMYEVAHPEGGATQQCNAAMYHALDLTAGADTQAGFIHVPGLPAQAQVANASQHTAYEGMPLHIMAGGILAAVGATIEHAA
jgi:pyroglutamyl-peptidase